MGEMQKSESNKKMRNKVGGRMVLMHVAKTNGVCVLGIASQNVP